MATVSALSFVLSLLLWQYRSDVTYVRFNFYFIIVRFGFELNLFGPPFRAHLHQFSTIPSLISIQKSPVQIRQTFNLSSRPNSTLALLAREIPAGLLFTSADIVLKCAKNVPLRVLLLYDLLVHFSRLDNTCINLLDSSALSAWNTLRLALSLTRDI